MFKLSYPEIVEKITQKTGMSVDEVEELVKQKLDQLSGLISKEGAAHIIANEKGIKLFDQVSGTLKIKSILSGMRGVETVGRVTNVFEVRKFKTETREGQVGSFTMGDDTGIIRVTLWNSQADNLRKIKVGDNIKISSAYVRENNGRRELHLNDNSQIGINPSGLVVPEVKPFVSVRKKISELKPDDQDIDLLGSVVNVFNPNFFEVCPKCGKRIRSDATGRFVCEAHGPIVPSLAYVLNIVIDDGSSSIRTACYRNQVLKLFNSDDLTFIKIKDNPQNFEEMKNELLGNLIRVVGRTKVNSMSNELEFVANVVFTNPDPEEELAKLK
jgi:hypothetical protein